LVISGWFPKVAAHCDAARHDVRVSPSIVHAVVTVPRDWTVVSGGRDIAIADGADSRQYELEIEDASELALAATRGLEISTDRFQPADGPAVALRTVLAPGSAARGTRLMAAAKDVLAVLSRWYGRCPAPQLTVVDVGWRSPDARAAFPGLFATAGRWL